jgi:hypothetical protein
VGEFRGAGGSYLIKTKRLAYKQEIGMDWNKVMELQVPSLLRDNCRPWVDSSTVYDGRILLRISDKINDELATTFITVWDEHIPAAQYPP